MEKTLSSDWLAALNHWVALAGKAAMDPCLIYGGDVASREGPTHVLPWRQLATPEDLPPALAGTGVGT